MTEFRMPDSAFSACRSAAPRAARCEPLKFQLAVELAYETGRRDQQRIDHAEFGELRRTERLRLISERPGDYVSIPAGMTVDTARYGAAVYDFDDPITGPALLLIPEAPHETAEVSVYSPETGMLVAFETARKRTS